MMPIVGRSRPLIDHHRAAQKNVGPEDLGDAPDDPGIGTEAKRLAVDGVHAFFGLGSAPPGFSETAAQQGHPGQCPIPEEYPRFGAAQDSGQRIGVRDIEEIEWPGEAL